MDHGGGLNTEYSGGGDKFCPWSGEETQDLLVIRAELDPIFMETRRNKILWEMVSTRMREIGYNRSHQQCKSKWKNLVTRYKGCETMEAREMRVEAFPFYNKMHFIFNERMRRMIWLEAQDGGAAVQISSNDEEGGGRRRKRKTSATGGEKGSGGRKSSSVIDGLKEIMEELMKQQMEMEMQWMKAYEEREARRREREMKWRQRMEALESERLMMVRWWGEREEQRNMREEARAQRRDALVNALLNKLTKQGN